MIHLTNAGHLYNSVKIMLSVPGKYLLFCLYGLSSEVLAFKLKSFSKCSHIGAQAIIQFQSRPHMLSVGAHFE